ncbi:hypothetical protein [Halonotius sp. GCM10025705]|uniref:hypothetical protein n=1 Tax=Halonotius sp. GCM10025705 TaxID=3252678 RepID=UPI00360EC1E2
MKDFPYDHPDRKIARDLYHKIREGEAFRMRVGDSLDDAILIVDPQLADVTTDRIVDRFVTEMKSRDGEWQQIADELEHWWSENKSIHDEYVIAFEYKH